MSKNPIQQAAMSATGVLQMVTLRLCELHIHLPAAIAAAEGKPELGALLERLQTSITRQDGAA